MQIDRLVHRLWRQEVVGAVAGSLVVLAAALAFSGHGDRGKPPSSLSRDRRPAIGHVPATDALGIVPSVFARTPSGVVEAATSYLMAFDDVRMKRSAARGLVNTIVTGGLRAKLVGALPVVLAQVGARLRSTSAPSAFDDWPLAYRLMVFASDRATVALWHLDAGVSSAIGLVTADYMTTTYTLHWTGGRWRIWSVANAPGPTPPAASAPKRTIDAFARSVSSFVRYRYAP
jgi:hypothetical protein